jgi:hypothetical protein
MQVACRNRGYTLSHLFILGMERGVVLLPIFSEPCLCMVMSLMSKLEM